MHSESGTPSTNSVCLYLQCSSGLLEFTASIRSSSLLSLESTGLHLKARGVDRAIQPRVPR